MKKIFAPLIAVAMALILFVICVCSTLCFALGDTAMAYADDTSAQSDDIVITSLDDLAGKTFKLNEDFDFEVFRGLAGQTLGLKSSGLITYTYSNNQVLTNKSFMFNWDGMGFGPSSFAYPIPNPIISNYSWSDPLYSSEPRLLSFSEDISSNITITPNNSFFSGLQQILSTNSIIYSGGVTPEPEEIDFSVKYYYDDTLVNNSFISVSSDYTSEMVFSNISGNIVTVGVNYNSNIVSTDYEYTTPFDRTLSRFVVDKDTNTASYYAYSYQHTNAFVKWFLDGELVSTSDFISVPANINSSIITTALIENRTIHIQITDYDSSLINVSYTYSKDIDFLNSSYEITTSGGNKVINYYAVSVPPPELLPPSFDGFDSDLTEEDFFGSLTKLFNLFQLTLAQLFTFGMLTTDINPVFQFFVAVLMIILTLDILKRLNIV